MDRAAAEFAASSFPRVRRVEICNTPDQEKHMIEEIDAPGARNPHSASHQAAPQLSGAFGGLIQSIQRAVAEEGYTTPTPIQQQCIEHVLAGRDVLGSAQTGTGKTAAFTLPLLQQLHTAGRRPNRSSPRALILAPTRELAAQIGDSITCYGRHLSLTHTVVFGGVGQARQVNAMNRGVDILVATPGRLLDLMQQGFIRLQDVEHFVLDEVDRMLDMGFIHDIKRVLAKLPAKRQTLFFSATMPPKMIELAGTMVRNPVRVTITPDKPAVERIEQRVMFVGKRHKEALLVSLLDNPGIDKVMVFTQMKHVANKVIRKLESVGIEGGAIHGNKSQAARTKALDAFKQGRFRVLVATDVAARGIDVDDVTHVINYDLPMEAETYVHRIGRTARAGREGQSISFCSSEERGQLRDIERLLGREVPAELEHDFHCQEAFLSTASSPPPRGGRGGNGGNSGGRGARPQNRPSSQFGGRGRGRSGRR
jgi:ATP-dependent RNA helicase RhlE